ncbi:MAG: endospore germination permease [Bacilli bacterium]
MKNKITTFSYYSIIIVFLVSSFLGIGVYSLFNSSKEDSIISLFISLLIGLLILLSYIKIFNYEPSLPIDKKINKLFGSILGTIINIFLSLNCLFISISLLYSLINLISTQFLSETPVVSIGLCLILTIIYANIKGINALSKTSIIILYINIFLFVLAFIPLISLVDFTNFRPILNKGIYPVIKGTYSFVTLSIIPLYFLLIIPKNLIEKEVTYKHIIKPYIFSIIIIILVTICTLGVLGIYASLTYQFPEYVVLKQVKLFNFIDRIENIVVLQWIFGLFVSLSIMIYYITNNIKKNTKVLPIIVSLIVLYLTIKLFKNNSVYIDITTKTLPIIRIITLIIFIIINILITIKKHPKVLNRLSFTSN